MTSSDFKIKRLIKLIKFVNFKYENSCAMYVLITPIKMRTKYNVKLSEYIEYDYCSATNKFSARIYNLTSIGPLSLIRRIDIEPVDIINIAYDTYMEIFKITLKLKHKNDIEKHLDCIKIAMENSIIEDQLELMYQE